MNDDFSLKIRINNILWSLGYYTRLEVKLAEYSNKRDTHMELTDLDVFGFRILPDFMFDYIVGDCTSNKDVVRSPSKRVFWLKGVMDHFGSRRGYLVLNTQKTIPEFQRQFAARLGVTIVNLNHLDNLEKRMINTEIGHLKLCQEDSWRYQEKNLSDLRGELHPILKFRKYNFWLNEPYQNISRILNTLPRYANLFEEKNKFHRALVIDLLNLLSLALLHMVGFVFQTNPEEAGRELRAYFYGGYEELRMRETIMEETLKLLETKMSQRRLFSSDIQLDPEYLSQLFSVVFRWVNKPFDSVQILRYLQMILFEKVLYESKNVEGIKYIDSEFSDFTKKFARDLAFLIIGKSNISEKMFIDIL